MQNALAETQIFITRDYEQFKFIKENRKINPRNYAKLIVSMKEEQLIIPILVNERMEIIDGQHRYTVCKELGLPIYFYVIPGYGIEAVKRANIVGRTWTMADFLNMHVEENKESYMEFKQIVKNYDINISDLLKLFSLFQDKNQKIVRKNFEEGILDLYGKDKVLEFLTSLDDFMFFESYKTKQFVGAFIKLYFQPNYNHQKMKERLKTRKDKFENKRSIGDYLIMLTKDVYSFGATKNPLYYDSETKRFYS